MTLITDPVLLCNDLGTKREALAKADTTTFGSIIDSSGHHSMSVKEAVRIAQSNNFMGLLCSSRLLVRPTAFLLSLCPCHLHCQSPLRSSARHADNDTQSMVPSLINAIKTAGLVLVTDTSEEPATTTGAAARAFRMPEGVDGVLRGNGVLRFNEMIDM